MSLPGTKRRKHAAFALAFLMLFTLLSGCGGSGSQADTQNSGKDANNGSGPNNAAPSEVSYPLQTDASKPLTYWAEYGSVKATMEEVPFFQEWQKRTGIPLKFVSPPAGQSRDSLNIMLASGDLPDMIEYDWFNFPGGPEKAIAEGYILRLNDVIDKYAPNLKKYLQANPDIDKMLKTDSGSYYTFPFLRGDPLLQVYQGPIIRQDWLDELGLKVPETIDDWHNMLTAFKDKKGATAPLSYIFQSEFLNNGAFIGAFGASHTWFQDNGTVKFGPMQPGYKEFLSTFRQWYAEGLLDKSIANVDGKALDTNITNGTTGATVHNSGSGIGKWLPLLEEKDPNAKLVAAPYPVLHPGDVPMLGQKDPVYTTGTNVAITSKAQNVELAARLLDWGYSEEGHMYFNFGQEGVSYEMKDGEPVYTDLLMNNPDKLSPSQAMSLYIRANYGGPFVQDKRYITQYLALPEQRSAIETWAHTDVDKYKLPQITPTPEEASELAQIMNDVNTLVDEMTLKIIMGNEPLDAFDSYMSKLKTLGIDRATEIQQAALDRYNNR
ncbi:extracellular solute-binding protein [Paenibacillus physcomitrellae]|uniref:Sugar ABC transporter permease n=1 Tax=Paenibacillus physcomitrellae TaxID=1619311 RepID=A0ABQ1G5I2_9BACL|nr:extracellular solute-binding protein [Paenibacillus physcomitrellae]GGA37032.1 sugar ABC transporter permease [Paenibacillus physcomitrellae]